MFNKGDEKSDDRLQHPREWMPIHTQRSLSKDGQ
jgi:hypothetical protein